MKKLYFIKTILASLFIMIFLGASQCGKKEPCDENNVGSVKIYNNLGITIRVDIWSAYIPGDGFLGERTISDGSSTLYDNVPAGSIEIWEEDANSAWGYWTESVSECETVEFEIYSVKKGEADNALNPYFIEEKLKGDRK
jgi:hypothetical protein